MTTPHRTHLFTATISVRWTDLDADGVVNHAMYLRFMEEARWKWFYSLSIADQMNCVFPVIEANCQYRKPVFFPENVIVNTYINLPADANITLQHHLSHVITTESNPDKVCAEGWVKLVCFDPVAKKVIKMPEVLREKLYRPDAAQNANIHCSE